MDINPYNVIRVLMEEFPLREESPITKVERDFGGQLAGTIKNYLVSNLEIEETTELVFENPRYADLDPTAFSEKMADACMLDVEDESEGIMEVHASSSGSWQATPTSIPPNKRDDIPCSKRKLAVEFWKKLKDSPISRKRKSKKRKSNRKTRFISSVQNRFRFVKSLEQLEYWHRQLETNGPLHEKMCRIATAVRLKYSQARLDRKTIHDLDLRRWALMESKKENISFKASKSWLHRFKKASGINSRKITRFVSTGSILQAEQIKESADDFVRSARAEFSKYSSDNIYNTDQSGFNLEMHSGRTLANIGEKTVEAVAQSVSATSHSYTIMPTVTASGKLLSPLVIVLKEPEGKFGPNVQHTIFKAKNVIPIAAKSSIMGKLEIKKWFDQAFRPNIGENSLLLVDSLNAYNCIKKDLSPGVDLKIKTLPPHTTGQAQPLDVFFFRQWKNFCRKISEYILLENVDFSLRNRNNIIKLQSLVHNQISAPRLLNFRKYSWHKAGYFEEPSEEFVNPVEFCFSTDEMWCTECVNVKLLKCGWCEKNLCFHHSLQQVHFHDK